MGPADINHSENYYNWPIFKKNYDPETLMTIVNDTFELKHDDKKIKIENDEDPCMICLDKIPDTIVLPCKHRVVCKDCSIGLRNTADKSICVHCRCPITNILE